jgi:hypothetical protein
LGIEKRRVEILEEDEVGRESVKNTWLLDLSKMEFFTIRS